MPFGARSLARCAAAIGCVLVSAAGSSAPAQVQTPAPHEDEWLRQPVDDTAFASFLEFFAYDHELPFETTVTDVQERDGIRVEHVAFQSTVGMRVTANLYRSAMDSGGAPPAVVFLHGGNIDGREGPHEFYEPLARAGWVVLAIDLLHFGERDTGLFETFMNTEKVERLYSRPLPYLEWVTQVVKDVGRSYDVLVGERGVDPQRVVLVGISRGAHLAFTAGGADARFAGVAAVVGGHAVEGEQSHRAPACPANYIGRIAPRPLFTLNGERDDIFPRETAVVPLLRLARSPHEEKWFDAGHSLPRELAISLLIDWLARVPPLQMTTQEPLP